MKRAIGVLLVGWMLALQTANATPITYDFHQGGYGGGADVSGFFLGDDLDGDGQLSSFAGEIFDFELNFSGAGFVPGFSLTFADLFGLVYDLDGGLLGDGTHGAVEGILAWNWDSLFAAGPGPLGLTCTAGSTCSVAANWSGALFSAEGIVVTAQVPEPAAGLLILIGLAGLVLARRQVKHSAER